MISIHLIIITPILKSRFIAFQVVALKKEEEHQLEYFKKLELFYVLQL